MAEAKQVVEKAEQMGIETIDVEILYQVQNENVVVNERIDHLLGKNGRELTAKSSTGGIIAIPLRFDARIRTRTKFVGRGLQGESTGSGLGRPASVRTRP
jgi:hypothetical protein